MEKKDEMLEKLFVSEDEANETNEEKGNLLPNEKEEDFRSINKEVNALAKQFEKKNRESLNKLRREEDLQDEEKEEIENEKIAKERKSRTSAILGLLAFPFVLIGGVLVWNYFISAQALNPLSLLTILMCITTFALGVKSLVKGIMRKSALKRKIGSILFGILLIAVAVTIVFVKEYIENFAFIVFGAFSAIIGFIALLFMMFKRNKKGFDTFKTIMSIFVFICAVMLILAGALFGSVEIYMQILGIFIMVVGCVLFVF